MSETIECDVKVDSTNDKKAKDDIVTVVLKGEQYITFMTEMGFSATDQVEFALTVKCGSMATAKHLGIERYGGTKKVVLRDRDESLESFDLELQPEMQQQMI